MPCMGAFPGETDGGRLAIGGLWSIAAAALAAWNTYCSLKMSQEQLELAELYLRIARNWHDWYNERYKPLEDQELAEAFSLAKPEPLFDTAIGRAKIMAKLAFRGQLEAKLRATNEYETGLRQARLKEILTARAKAVAALAGAGRRNEQNRVDALDDRRWKRREAVVNRGRDQMADNVKYGQLAMGILGDLSGQAAAGAAGAMSFLGYRETRMETYYPGYDPLERSAYLAPGGIADGSGRSMAPGEPPLVRGAHDGSGRSMARA